ncbi:general substrate transporter [Talaromyces proteolyticus]|uniref:General substrate transporter n=1 Tax=Talaromyces proteolyticus TaxID=1131652 RepID=A0AAD4KS59_9EURO|nr:general substrate transporter [Talaromyces proteolyticus]KAH8698000.1 general substrate transporter [Talaromyces proteolyticus]
MVLLGSVFIIVGSVLMGSCFERVQMMIGRVLTGIGINYASFPKVAPVYQSEVCFASQRGWHVCCQMTMMLFGLMVAYWINYGLFFCSSVLQWRFPLLFQLIFAVYILIVTTFLPDTPRWLMWNEPHSNRGIAVLAKLRNRPIDHPLVLQEREEISTAIQLESDEGRSWIDLFQDRGVRANKRFHLAIGIQFMQQMTEINIITYYGPILFKENLRMDKKNALLIGSFLHMWYIIASFLTWRIIDTVGRRRLLVMMAIGMSAVLVLEAICVAINNRASSIAAVFFVFAFSILIYSLRTRWMACVWVYPAEILPVTSRAKGAALAAGADFLGNFLVAEITPPALQNIGYKTFIIFVIFNVISATIVWLFYPEMMGLSLEEINFMFLRDDSTDQPHDKFYQRLQWHMVSKAWTIIAEVKAGGRYPIDMSTQQHRSVQRGSGRISCEHV